MDKEQQVAVTQSDIREIKRDVTDLSMKVNEVHAALIGSSLAKDGGMVQRLMDCEQEVEHVKEKLVTVERTMQEKIEEAKRANLKSELYIKIIWGLGGSICAGVFTTIMYFYFKK